MSDCVSLGLLCSLNISESLCRSKSESASVRQMSCLSIEILDTCLVLLNAVPNVHWISDLSYCLGVPRQWWAKSGHVWNQ